MVENVKSSRIYTSRQVLKHQRLKAPGDHGTETPIVGISTLKESHSFPSTAQIPAILGELEVTAGESNLEPHNMTRNSCIDRIS